jgi:geranylgeranyl reductase family protein
VDADVVIAGAGPAGAVAARVLAKAGFNVILCDKSTFPRDKACGDGLIPDALAALRTIGLETEVRAEACDSGKLTVLSPSGIAVRFAAPLQVVPRLTFDHILFRGAIDAGARFQHVSVDAPILEGDRVVGVTATGANGHRDRIELRAPLTVLATGGAGAVLGKFDPSARVSPSGIAVRTYARRRAGADTQDLFIALERDLLPGYAWAFPTKSGLWNIGVGVLSDRSYSSSKVNLRERLDELLAGAGVLGARLGPMQAEQPYRGAPLRTGLAGSSLGRPGLAIVGEAGGTTYAVSGEGIGKAMESSLLMAELATASRAALPEVGPRFAHLMRQRHQSRFRAYTLAQRWVSYPRLADYIARRANESAWVHERLTGVINERELPSRVFSLRAVWRLIMQR